MDTKMELQNRTARNSLERKDTLDKIMDEVIAEPDKIKHKTAEEWDNTVIPAAEHAQYPPGEAFVVPIDVTDVKHKPPITKIADTFAAKKTVAQGMMDIALITANANQLRYIIEFNRHSSTFYLNLVLIIISLILQVAVGLCLIFKGRSDLRGESKSLHARRMNNGVVVGVFLVTIINVFIASFTITTPGPSSQVVQNPN